MELNHLQSSFKIAMEELNFINGRVGVLNSFITQTKERIDKDKSVGNDLITSGLPFRNITLDKETDNLFLPSNYYKLNRQNLKEEIDMILSRECLFQISQAYELVETYLYNQVSELIRLKSNLQIFVDYKTNTASYASIRKALKGLSERTNNRHLLAILRSNCAIYSNYEMVNIYDLDFKLWYEMLSEVRHCITHSRGRVTNVNNELQIECFKLYFKVISYDHSNVLFIDYSNCRDLLSRIADYVFFVYKAVSEACYGITVDFDSVNLILPDERYPSNKNEIKFNSWSIMADN